MTTDVLRESPDYMGTLAEAETKFLARCDEYRQYRQPFMGSASDMKKRDAAEREALFRLGQDALLLSWHMERREALSAPATPFGRPISEAPHDREILVYAPAYQDLRPLYSVCQWHPDAGFCIDELRQPDRWWDLPPAWATGGGWLPIETAPKDGTEILICFYNFGEAVKGIGMQVTAWREEGWRDTNVQADGTVPPEEEDWVFNDPIAWMPLPTPPAVEG